MTEEICRKVDRETRADASGRCERFDVECPECGCEQFSFGNGSPGIIRDHEKLVRFHFSPEDIQDGKPTTASFSDVTNLGLSVTRDDASDAEITAAISLRLKNLGGTSTWHSVSLANVDAVRGLLTQQDNTTPGRAFCVYDTAEDGNRMHAEVCASRRVSKGVRKKLRDIFSVGHVSRDQFRGGILNPQRTDG